MTATISKITPGFPVDPSYDMDWSPEDADLNQYKGLFASAVFAAWMVVPTFAQAANNLLFESDFESENFSGWRLHANKKPELLGTVSIVNSPKRAGNRAACFDLRRDPVNAPKRRRSELHLAHRKPEFGKEYWYGWSRYIPPNWVFDNKVSSVMGQWHLNNAAIPAHAPNRPSNIGVPVVFIGDGPTLRIKLNGPNSQTILYQASYTDMKGKWTDYVVHAKWSPKTDGILEIWQNGQKIVNYRGATSTFDPTGGPYFNIGIYKPQWKPRTKAGIAGDTNHVEICYDEVRIGGQEASYSDVAPRSPMHSPSNEMQKQK